MPATLYDNETARDFASLLPFTLPMEDLFSREKFGSLPRAIADGAKRQHIYEVGQIIYWSPGPDVAIFYNDDRRKIPNPGIIVMGKVQSGVEALLQAPGSVRVKFEAVHEGDRISLAYENFVVGCSIFEMLSYRIQTDTNLPASK